jgi:2-pyrone-4,6-dicarboxylate lactonase
MPDRSTARRYSDRAAEKIQRGAPERMVWGSDWPHVNFEGMVMPNDGDLLD